MFIAGNNMIQVYCHGMRPDEIKLKSLDNTLRIGTPEIKGDTTSVLAMPYVDKKGKNKNMRMAILNKKTSKIIKTINFSCDSIPKLIARVGRIQGSEAARNDILSQTVMNVVFPNSLYSYPYRIKQYVFKISTPKGGATISANGIFIPKDVLQEIKDAPAGTIAEFTNIKVTCPECVTRTLDDVKLKIR